MASQSHSSASQSSSQSQQQSPTSNLALNHRSAASNLKSPTTSMTNHFLTSIHPNDWSNSQVSLFLDSLSLSSYSSTFGQNDITGDALILLDEDTLKELGVESVGHRLNLLGAIYRLKERWGIQLEHGDWVPGCEYKSYVRTSSNIFQESSSTTIFENQGQIQTLTVSLLRHTETLESNIPSSFLSFIQVRIGFLNLTWFPIFSNIKEASSVSSKKMFPSLSRSSLSLSRFLLSFVFFSLSLISAFDFSFPAESILNFNPSEPLSQFSVTHLLKERDERIRNLELEIWRLSDHLNRFAGDLSGFLKNNSKVS